MTLAERIRQLTQPQRASLLSRLTETGSPGEKEIAACIVCKPGLSITESELRIHLGSQLPDFMIPARFEFLTALPLNPNGKIDRKALQAKLTKPTNATPVEKKPETKAANEIESKLAQIWSELLHVDTVNPDDNFFRLGGHSLLALQVMACVRDTFKADLPLKTLFDSPTVAGLAKAIANRPQNGASPIRKVARTAQPADASAQPRFTT